MKYIVPVYVLCSLLFISCQEQQQQPNDRQLAQEPAQLQKDELPVAQIADTLLIEGMPTQVNLQLYRAPESFPLSFYTYLPPNMTTRSVSSGEGDGIIFSFNEAQLRFFVLPAQTSKAEAIAQVREVLGVGVPQVCEAEFEWLQECYETMQNPEKVSKVFLGEHKERYFYINVDYPVAYGDGFTPRYHLLLEHWNWLY